MSQVPQQLHMPVSDAVLRRRSADVGGLYIALRDADRGWGWLDSSTPSDSDTDNLISTKHAVLLSTMHTETLRLLESSAVQRDPPELSREDRVRLLKNIEAWYFEPLRMSEDEVFTCVVCLFQVLFRIEGMQEALNIDFNIIPRFILHIRQLYRWQNHYHNFEHAVDVLQAIHCYLRTAGVVPPVTLLLSDVGALGNGMWSSTREHDSEPLVTCLTPREIFALYLAAIGHDVAHPGFNNPFINNAEAPLSQVYENGSALEQMHSYMLLKTMRYHGMGVLLDDPETGQHFRRILRGSVLATDMGVHNDFMNKFAKLLDTWSGNVDWQAAKFERQEFTCKLLLKNADISNPSRPFPVSQQWSSALQQEWACQYKFENFLELTHSVNPSNGELAEANSQVFFTGKIAKPLVDMTAVAIPELRQYSYHCAENLREWELRLKKAKEKSEATSATTTTTAAAAAAKTDSTAPAAPPLSPPRSSSASSPRQNNTIITPNYPTFTTSSLRSQTTTTATATATTTATTTTTTTTTTSASQTQTSPVSILPPRILSPGTTIVVPTTGTPSSLSSSSNPVSPRILNPTSDNDYSGMFRMTRPKGSSSSTTSPSATPSSGFGMSSSSGGGAGRVGQISRTPSSNESGENASGGESGGGGVFVSGNNGASSVVGGMQVLLPSLKRAAVRVIAGAPSRSTGSGVVGFAGGGGVGSNLGAATATAAGTTATTGSSEGSVTLWPSAVEPPRQFLPRSLMYPHPIAYVRPPLQSQHQYQANSNQNSEVEQTQVQSPPPNTPSYSSTPYHHPEGEAYEGINGTTVALGSDIDGVGRGGLGAGGGNENNNGSVDEDVVYEREVEQRHQGFRRAVERGIGVGSLRRRSSGNILSGTPPTTASGGSGGGMNTPAGGVGGAGAGSGSTSASVPVPPPPPPPPTSAMSSLGFESGSMPPSPHGNAANTHAYHHHHSRASWSSGEGRYVNFGTVEDARGELRGRWGAAGVGAAAGAGAAGGTAKAVASEEGSGGEDDNGKDEGGRRVGGGLELGEGSSKQKEEEEDDERNSSSIPTGLVSAAPINKSSSSDGDLGNQHSSVTMKVTDVYWSGSPTLREKGNMTVDVEESDGEGKKKRDDPDEERRKKLREEEEEEEEEKRRKQIIDELIREEQMEKEQERKEGEGSGGKKSLTKSRSRSKLRKKRGKK